jgi:hypothetical protein
MPIDMCEKVDPVAQYVAPEECPKIERGEIK